jgi:NAD(P)-dependent dehydrogenase (short-subunit alcohol dehydrogenase family)
MKQSMEGKVALVTGSSSGIGRATALAFAREGAIVIVNADKNVQGGEETVDMIKKTGGQAIFIKADVSIVVQVNAMFNQVIESYGRLDFAFNNAGGGHVHLSTLEHTDQDWDRTVNSNVKGMWLCMKHEIAQMLKQGGGAIVNTSSLAGLGGIPQSLAYVVSKHGVNGLTKVAAVEYAKSGIRVNAVCPGLIATERLMLTFGKTIEANPNTLGPSRRLGTCEEVAELVVWLCSDAASFVTGQIIAVDGGISALQVVPDADR